MAGSEAGGFASILHPGMEEPRDAAVAADAFRDLNLDAIVEDVTARWESADVATFFRTVPRDLATVTYRQDVMRDLEADPARRAAEAFCERMRDTRRRFPRPEDDRVRYQRARRLLDAARTYVEAVRGLQHDLAQADPASSGLRALRDHLEASIASAPFRALEAEAADVAGALDAVRYVARVRGDRVSVLPYAGESAATPVVERLFERFRGGAVRTRFERVARAGGMNHVQAQIVERVARHHPDTFAALEAFGERHASFIDPVLERFDREVPFYLAYLAYVAPLRDAGLPFCYPRMLGDSKEVAARGAFDLALAAKLVRHSADVVLNDVVLRGAERVFVVTGPNQGGKTTFARAFGQLHVLGALGCLVPAREASLFLFDRVLTHFERVERVETLRGKLHDDLVRLRDVLDAATSDSIVVLNEIFSSATSADALLLGRRVLARISALDALGVCVTFLDELSTFDEKTVSLVAGIDPTDATVRTFRLERRPADGLAYALAIAGKHRVTRTWLLERVRP